LVNFLYFFPLEQIIHKFQKYWQEQQKLQSEVEQLYDRWQALEAIKDG